MGDKFLKGWELDPEAIEAFKRDTDKPLFGQQNGEIKGIGEGKRVDLMAYWKKVTGTDFINAIQEIGDCVGQASTLAVDLLSIVEIALGDREEWLGQHATEVTYGLSRVEIGGGKLGRGDGSRGAWAVQALKKFGVIRRGQYGAFDLRKYRPDLAKEFGFAGVPKVIEDLLGKNIIKTATLVTEVEQARDSIASGYPVIVCSSRGYVGHRDKDGFVNPNRRGWGHATLATAVDDVSERKGFKRQNSWPKSWTYGPEHAVFPLEPSAFMVDYKYMGYELEEGDSYAVSFFDGYPAQTLDYIF